MTNVNGTVRMARFIGRDTTLGKQIMAQPLYARYRTWLGKEVEVQLQTAEMLSSATIGLRVRVTVLNTRDTEMVRVAHITGLTFEDIETMRRVAQDRRSPTSRPGSATTTNTEEVAPPA